MGWPEFKQDVPSYEVTCPGCNTKKVIAHPSSGKGRIPSSLRNHLVSCRPGMTARERSEMAERIWADKEMI